MSLATLTTSGWCWFAWCLACTLGFIVRVVHSPQSRVRAIVQVPMLAVQWVWLLWLVTP